MSSLASLTLIAAPFIADDLTDDTIVAAIAAAIDADPFYSQVFTADLYPAFNVVDAIKGKARRDLDPSLRLKHGYLQQLIQEGPSLIAASDYFKRPKAAKTAADALPDWYKLLHLIGWDASAGAYVAAINDALSPANRAKTAAACEGLPAAVVDWRSLLVHGGHAAGYYASAGNAASVQVFRKPGSKDGTVPPSYFLAPTEGAEEVTFNLATGYRNDLARTYPKKIKAADAPKADGAAPAPTPAPDAEAPAPDAEATPTPA